MWMMLTTWPISVGWTSLKRSRHLGVQVLHGEAMMGWEDTQHLHSPSGLPSSLDLKRFRRNLNHRKNNHWKPNVPLCPQWRVFCPNCYPLELPSSPVCVFFTTQLKCVNTIGLVTRGRNKCKGSQQLDRIQWEVISFPDIHIAHSYT